MKKVFTLTSLLCIVFFAKAQSVAINTDGSNADTSAILDISSTSKGLLIPRMKQNQRNAIFSPATGLMIYQTNDPKGFYYYNGNGWTSLVDNKNNLWSGDNLNVYNTTAKIGIGTDVPRMPLHIASTSGLGMVIENPVILGANVQSGLYFKSSNYYYGGIKAIGTSFNSGRLGFFTYGDPDSTLLLERLSILDNGYVGINTTAPTSALEVNGNTVVDGTAYVTSLGVSSNASVTGNLTAGSENVTGNLSVSGTASVTGKITSGGLAAVVSSSTQMRIVVYSGTLTVNNLAANTLLSATGNIGIAGGTFSSAPTVYVGDIVASTENGDYYRAVIIPDQVTTNNIRIKIFNPTATPISFSNVTWHFMAIGAR